MNSTANTAKKITAATVKSFIANNLSVILLKTESRFDGMEDGVRRVEGAAFRKPDVTKFNKTDKYHMGVQGICFVGGTDYFTVINTAEFTGFEVYNCCGSWKVVVPANSQAASKLRTRLGVVKPFDIDAIIIDTEARLNAKGIN